MPADCIRPLKWIRLHAARPAGLNEPTAAGRPWARRKSCGWSHRSRQTTCAFACSPAAARPSCRRRWKGFRWKTNWPSRGTSASRRDIEQLNTVRKQLSRIKGGGLARACRAGRLISLIISDVPGDPLDLIASGPTVEDRSTPEAAWPCSSSFPRAKRASRRQSSSGSSGRTRGYRSRPVPGNELGNRQQRHGRRRGRQGGRAAGLFPRDGQRTDSRKVRPKRWDAIWLPWHGKCEGRRARIA